MFAEQTALEIYLTIVLGLAVIATVLALGTLASIVVRRMPHTGLRARAGAHQPLRPTGRLSTHSR